MVRRGVPETAALKISGHRTRAVFDGYNVKNESDLAHAARKIEAESKFGQKTGRISIRCTIVEQGFRCPMTPAK